MPYGRFDGRALRVLTLFCYSDPMEQTSFELTPHQKGLLASIANETGEPVAALLDEALEVLQIRKHEHHGHVHNEANGDVATPVVAPSPLKPKHIWEIAEEIFGDLPEEDLAMLPVDGAARHDHYIRHGLPKKPQ